METIRSKSLIFLILCFLVVSLRPGFAEASVTVAWDQTTTNADGTACSDLAGYRIYYDTDGSGAPYNGTGLSQGNSPISVPVASLSDPANPELTLSGLTAGVTYHIAVTSYDTSGNESGYSNEVTATESVNHAPTASAGADQTVTQSQLTGGSIQVNLDGSGSSDPDGDNLTYSWVQVSGGAVNLLGSTAATPFFSATSALSGQTLVFKLTVNDGKASSTDTVQVVVEQAASSGNSPPTASVSASPTQGQVSLSVRFYGLGTDTDGTIASYAWNFGDGSSGSGSAPTHVYRVAGTYTATLTITDNQGATATASQSIVVSDHPNVPPSVTMTADKTTGVAPLTVAFTANASDSDGQVTGYVWDFGDHSSAYTANPSHTFSAAGGFAVSLRVTDNNGGETTVSKMITVYDSQADPDHDGLSNSQELKYGLDPNLADSDGDGISDFVEWGNGVRPIDSDGDGTIDVLDLDSDNDGKPDAVEGIGDSDNDGAPNYVDMNDTDGPNGDQDGDGISNSTEVTYGLNPNLADSDGDGISDQAEFDKGKTPIDSDGDGTIDALDLDSDNDGKPDAVEGTGDSDNDGAPNYVDMNDTDGPNGDQDGDGLTNIEETSIALNPNLTDSDQDGIPDSQEIGNISSPLDSDGDGIIDALDTDSDNDGIPDSQELSNDIDGDGVPDRLDATLVTLEGKKGKIALKVSASAVRIAEAVFISSPSAYLSESLPADFSYGGFQYKIENVAVGGSVTVTIYSQASFPADVEYWKYDTGNGFTELSAVVSGNRLSFTLTDGGTGDADKTANGVIVDPGFVGEPLSNSSGSSGASAGSGGGGGGCALSGRPGNGVDGLFLLLPVFVLIVRIRCRKQ